MSTTKRIGGPSVRFSADDVAAADAVTSIDLDVPVAAVGVSVVIAGYGSTFGRTASDDGVALLRSTI